MVFAYQEPPSRAPLTYREERIALQGRDPGVPGRRDVDRKRPSCAGPHSRARRPSGSSRSPWRLFSRHHPLVAEEPEPSPTPTSTSAPTPAPTPTRRATSTPTPSAPTASPSGPSTHVEPDHEAIDAAVLRVPDRRGRPDHRGPELQQLPGRRGHPGDGPPRRPLQRAARVARHGPRRRGRRRRRRPRPPAPTSSSSRPASSGPAPSCATGSSPSTPVAAASPTSPGCSTRCSPSPTTSATRSATCPTSPSSAPAPSRTSASSPPSRSGSAPPPTRPRSGPARPARRSRRTRSRSTRPCSTSARRSPGCASCRSAEVQKAGPVAGMLVGARSAEARAAAARLRDALSAATFDVTNIGKPCTDDSTVYPNGMIPTSGLCPVWGAPGERLSPDAAAAFSALSKAYAAQTGTAAVHHRLLPLLLRAGLGQGHPRPVRGHPRHEPARPGPRPRPLRWRAALRLRCPPLDDRQRPALRLVPPLVGRRRGLAPRAVALRVRRLTEPPRHRDTRP